ncbi:MAG: hypothetical protein ACKVQA_10630 [Burkholderiales bacterium]
MNKFGLLAYAANVAPRLLKVRRSTWIATGIGLLVTFGLLIWAAIALIGWLWGQVQGLPDTAPAVVRDTARGVVERAKEVLPAARETLGEFVPSLKPDPARPEQDVSGGDLGPVARYPGLVRTRWQQDGAKAQVEYSGKAGYAQVLAHYANGFTAHGFTQSVQSAAPESETHAYSMGTERLVLTISRKPKDEVSVRIEGFKQ